MKRLPAERKGGRPVVQMGGRRLGKLLVLEIAPRPEGSANSSPGAWWRCLCDCGREVDFPGVRLRYGRVLDCRGSWHKRAKAAR